MLYDFKLPDLGEGISEGEIVRWLVSEGQTVTREQPVVEVMTDKVTAELPSPVSGTVVRLAGAPGDVIPVHSPLLTIDLGGEQESVTAESGSTESGAAPQPSGAEEGVAAATGSEPPGNGSAAPVPLAVPAVRRLARELGVELSRLSGSGPGGRIVEADVRAAAAAGAPQGERREPLRGIRRATAEHMLASHQSTAPYTIVEEADVTELVALRERVQPLAAAQGVRITYLPFLMVAASMALKEHPRFNATVDPENGDLVLHEEQQFSVAVHTEEGLLVPVIRGVERRGLLELAREIERVTGAARGGRLSREDVAGGTFTITSMGAIGGLMGTPVLNTPQVAILGIHRIAPRAVVRDGQIVARRMVNLSLTLDHRYIDGYEGATFAQAVVRNVQDPAVMLFALAELRGKE